MKIKKELILLKQEANNWEEAIRLSAKKLLEHKYIEDRYIDALVKSVNNLGPYIVIAPNFAIPHARPEDGVKKAGVSLTTFKEPVIFNEIKSAQVFLTISAVDNNSHLEILQVIASKLSDETISKLSLADNVNKIEEILK